MQQLLGIAPQVLFGQLLIGLINGAFYAILSLGLAVIFGLLNIINFTHGAQYMLGAFCAWFLLTYLGIGYWWALLNAFFFFFCTWFGSVLLVGRYRCRADGHGGQDETRDGRHQGRAGRIRCGGRRGVRRRAWWLDSLLHQGPLVGCLNRFSPAWGTHRAPPSQATSRGSGALGAPPSIQPLDAGLRPICSLVSKPSPRVRASAFPWS